MPRPKNKTELLEESQKQYNNLLSYISQLSEEEKTQLFPEGMLNRNIRDVLAHLDVWHKMMLTWFETGKKGIKPDIPTKGFTWKTLPELNRLIQKNNEGLTYDEVFISFGLSYQEIRKLIISLSEEELFEKNTYAWTGTTTLGAYLISATSSHYVWALKIIKKALRETKNQP